MSSEKDGTNLIAADNRRLFCLSVFTSTSVSTTSIPCDLNSYFFTFSRSSAASFSFPKSSFALLSLSSVSIFSPFFCFSLSCQFSQSLLLFLFLLSFIHSFIHYGDLYIAPSRLLLRSAPNPCTAKKKSFETRVECVRKNPGEQSLRQ